MTEQELKESEAPSPEGGEGVDPGERPSGGAERWVYAFLAFLLVLNGFIFLGSGGSPEGQEGRPPRGGGQASRDSGPGSPGSPVPVGSNQPSLAPPGGASPPTRRPRPGEGSLSPGGEEPPREDRPASPPPPPGRGDPASPPPPPGGEGRRGPAALAGPELILGILALDEHPEVRLAPEQRKAVSRDLDRLLEPQQAMEDVVRRAQAYLSPEQVDWLRANRGPVALEPGEAEPGMDPVASAAWRLLEERSSGGSGSAKTFEHEATDLHFQDLLNGLVRLGEVQGALALTPQQARALAPLVQEGNRARQQEDAIFQDLSGQLDPRQVEFLQENRQLVRPDVNRLLLLYARKVLEK